MNVRYKQLSLQKLLLLENWVHHKSYLLKQGRVSWLNVNKNEIKDIDDDDGESNVESDVDAAEADENVNEINPELQLPLFTSCSSDITNGEFALWIMKMRNTESCPIVVVKSNLWPGAFSFAKGR